MNSCEPKSLQTYMPEHVLVAKVGQLSRNMLLVARRARRVKPPPRRTFQEVTVIVCPRFSGVNRISTASTTATTPATIAKEKE